MGVDSSYGAPKPTVASPRAASAALRATAARRRAATAARTAAVGARAAGIGTIKSASFNNPYVQRNTEYARMLNTPRDRYNQKTVDAFNNTIGAVVGVNVGKHPGVDPVSMALTFAPFGAIGKLGKYVIPEALRIGLASTRVASRAKRTEAVARGFIHAGEWDMEQGIKTRNVGFARQTEVLGGNVNTYTSRGHGAFDEHLGYDLSSTEHGIGVRQGEELVQRGLATKEYSKSGNSWIYRPTGGADLVAQGESQYAQGVAIRDAALRQAAIAGGRTTARAASAELRRRLAVLRAARNR